MRLARRRRALVIRSIETPAGERCVDLFRREDESFGFEEYRRDGEDPAGWRPVGGYGEARFGDQEAALRAARAAVPWLDGALADTIDG